jgi:hypothetical protein
MAHHHAHTPRTVTLTLPRVRLPRWFRKLITAGRTLEQVAERHWPMAAYGVLTLASAAYIVFQLTKI